MLDLPHHDPRRAAPDATPGDLVLDREQVDQRTVVTLRPHVAAARGIDELGRDPDRRAGPSHTPLQHVTDIQVLRHLAHIARLPAIGERRVPRNDEERMKLRQLGDDVLADAVGEVLLLGIATHVRERQEGDGGGGAAAWGAPSRFASGRTAPEGRSRRATAGWSASDGDDATFTSYARSEAMF